MSKISIIIPTYNSNNFIKPCLDSVFSQNYQDIEVIVIDNGSKDGTVELVSNSYPQVVLIKNKVNLGACKARNQGINISKGEWIIAMDCDIMLDKDFLITTSNLIKNLPSKIGTIQPKILKENKKIIYSTGIHLSFLKRFYDIGRGRFDKGKFDKTKYIFGACSAAAFYKRKLLDELHEETGYFDERFFFLVEDVDLSWRANRRGWKAMYYPEAICCHIGNSSQTDSALRRYFCFRNRYLMINKNETVMGRIRIYSCSFFYEISRFLYLVFTNKYFWKPPQLN